MGQALISNNNLTVKSILFGLKKQLVYIPTGSPVKAIKKNYHSDAISSLRRIIESNSKGLAAAVKAFNSPTQPIGNIELDMCISSDKNFVALQLLQFGEEYAYHPQIQDYVLTVSCSCPFFLCVETVQYILKLRYLCLCRSAPAYFCEFWHHFRRVSVESEKSCERSALLFRNVAGGGKPCP